MRSRPILIAACALAVTLGATACGSGDNRLFVIVNPSAQEATAKVWAVEPGAELDKSALVSEMATGPVRINTLDKSGMQWVNNIGRTWQGKVLLGTTLQAGSRLTAGDPGGKQTTIAGADQLGVLVTDRGVIASDKAGCKLATGVERATTVGEGLCTLSDDGRWLASWPAEGGALQIRDLRHDTVTTVKGSFTHAVALGHDARVLGLEETDSTTVAKVIDAKSGSVLKSNTWDGASQAMPSNPRSTGFALSRSSRTSSAMLWIDTDGNLTTVATATGELFVPVTAADGVHYLRLGADPSKATLYHWSPGGTPVKLLAGELTATAAGPDSLVVTRQSGARMQFWHTTRPDELSAQPDLTLAVASGDHAAISSAFLQGDTVHAVVAGSTASSYVRIDLAGDDDAAPARNWSKLDFQSIDTDGTVLLVGAKGQVDRTTGATPTQQLLAVHPGADTTDVRATSSTFGLGLVHNGTIYYTSLGRDNAPAVWKVPASSKDKPKPELLYRNAQQVGAAWPEFGGGTVLQPIDGIQLLQQASGQSGGQSGGSAGSGGAVDQSGGQSGDQSGAAGGQSGGGGVDTSGLSVNSQGQIVDQNGNVVDPSQIPGLTGGGTGGSSGQSSSSGEPAPAAPGSTIDPTATTP